MALEARTLILLIDFKGHPILADELTNNLRYNYFWGKKFDLVRENLPFFVMIEIPKILIGSKVCWKGNIFWEQNDNKFLNLNNDTYDCELVSQKDISWIYYSKFGEFISPLKVTRHYSFLRELKTIDSKKSFDLEE